LGDRLWIPHQVAHEFHRNRLSVIAAQEAFFGKARDELEASVNSYLGKLKAFTSRIAMPEARSQELERMIRDAHAQVLDQVASAEEANEVHLDHRDSDEVLARLEALFDNRVGEPMEPGELEAARKEAKRRMDQKIPPGYADKDKADSSGDYLVWKQLLQEAGARQLPVVLVTDDRKEDWVRREHGLTLGPRPELCEEMSAAASAPFFLMSTATFLRHAREYLSVSVSPGTVNQANELPGALDERTATILVQHLEFLDFTRTQHEEAARDAAAAATAERAILKAIERAADQDDSVSQARLKEELRVRQSEHALAKSRVAGLMEREERMRDEIKLIVTNPDPNGLLEDTYHYLLKRHVLSVPPS
jgi:PIN like domain